MPIVTTTTKAKEALQSKEAARTIKTTTTVNRRNKGERRSCRELK
jgi:hypothetical protein